MKRNSNNPTVGAKSFWGRGQPNTNASQQKPKFSRFSKPFKSQHHNNVDGPKPRKPFFGGNRNRSASTPVTKPSLNINTDILSPNEVSSETSIMALTSSPVSAISENKENKSWSNSTHQARMNSAPAPLMIGNAPSHASPLLQAKQQKPSPIKTLPRSLMRSLSRKNRNSPTISLTIDPQISPPSLSYASHQHDTSNNRASFSLRGIQSISTSEKPKKQRQNSIRPKSFLLLSPSMLANAVFRRNRNRSSSMSDIDPGIGGKGINNMDDLTMGPETLRYESFPDPDREDFVEVDMWDLPDSLSATEDAGGVLQMIEYDGILINGVVVG